MDPPPDVPPEKFIVPPLFWVFPDCWEVLFAPEEFLPCPAAADNVTGSFPAKRYTIKIRIMLLCTNIRDTSFVSFTIGGDSFIRKGHIYMKLMKFATPRR